MPSKQSHNNNFKIVANAVNHPFTTVKLKFLSYLAYVLRPYLEKYQNNDPLVLIMTCRDTLHIVKSVMRIAYNTEYNWKCVLKMRTQEEGKTQAKSLKNLEKSG